MKPVLIVAPFFAPQSHAAVFRAHKLAKHLPEYGWKPYVLTVDTNYLYNEDANLLEELPEAVEIVRAQYVEPTVRGARMALGGTDRTFVSMKETLVEARDSGSVQDAIPHRASSNAIQRLAGSAYGQVRTQWLNSPDAYWTWERPAIRAGRELIRQHGIEIVLSTAMPYTAHRVGRALQREGADWVADFRDPAGYGAKMSSPAMRVLARQREIVKDTLSHADMVTTTANSYALIFADLFGDITREPIRWIPTGVDEALIHDEPADIEDPYLLYVGEVMPDQTESFFDILAHAFQQDRAGHKLVVVGHELMNRSRLGPVLNRYDIQDRVQFVDHVPQADVYRLLLNARAGVLVPGQNAYWWNLHAKLVDYAGLRKPVVALVPDPSEARSVLGRSNLGVFLDGDLEQATTKLAAFFNGELPPPEPVAAECDRYLARSQVAAFASVFESLV